MDDYEKHFNDLQHKTRSIASTWILAGFAAIAYFIKSKDPVFEYFSSYTMINLISLMVVIGLFILWILDQVVYQRLLNAIFVTGLYKESVDPKVDPIRVMMVIGSEYKGMSKSYDLFYFIPMLSFNLFSAGAWTLENIILGSSYKTNAVSSTIGMIVILMTASIWAYIKYKRGKNRFSFLLRPFNDKDFEKIGILKTSPQKCFEICAKWAQSKSRVSE